MSIPLSEAPIPQPDLSLGLVEALGAAGLVDPAGFERACQAAAAGATRLDRALLELGLVNDGQLAGFFSTWLDIPQASQTDFETLPVPELAEQSAFLRRSMIAPVRLVAGRLLLAMADPLNLPLLEALAFRLDLPVDLAVATKPVIQEILDRDYPMDPGDSADAGGSAETEDLERLRSLASEGPVIKLVGEIVSAAVQSKASDIHFEALEAELQVRFRIDGELRRHRAITGDQRSAVISRLKVMAHLNISERRRPQDGRIRVAIRGRNIDFRLSTLPTQFGESVVLRVLDRSRVPLEWDALGFDPEMTAKIADLTSRPHGLFLVTGPTGSGKTTTLYTALSKLDAARRKIFTVEDPIEYTLPGINQVQVRPELDLTFASALRAILRQDPDVVMVGEIRDLETAENAVRAALMGRIVLSTMHTNSARGAVNRLIDLGVPRFLLASVLQGVLAQRLERRVCEVCGGQGCDHCGQEGHAGRLAVGELLEMTPEERNAIVAEKDLEASLRNWI
ncbi:MAG: GspE/PulE family protein [Myxococcota bacterium]